MATPPAGSRRQAVLFRERRASRLRRATKPADARCLTWIWMSEGLPRGDLTLVQWYPLVILWYVSHMFIHE